MQATLSHYRVLEQVGAGAMGVVYRAHDEHLDRDVALKILPLGTVVDPAARKRFRKEALMLSKLNHPNIATVHDFDTDDGTDFLVEEFIDGLSLDAIVGGGPLSESEIINLGSQLVEGLAAAHEHGVIHRDLKPANLRVTSEARLKILDFGLADMLRGEVSPDALTESKSESRAFVGTLPYMAPEQLLQGKLDARTDIWGAGCVLYEMATGRRPFLGAGPALTDAILHQPLASVSKLNPRIGAAFDSIIQKCLEKNPQRRYTSAREIAVDLQRAAAPTQPRRRRWSKSWLAVMTVTTVLIVGVAAKPSLQRILQPISHIFTTPDAGDRAPVPHESYLAGLKYLERWDRSNNLDLAASKFQQAVQADPKFALGFSALAEVAWARYRLDHDSRWVDEAEKNCHQAAQLNSQLPAVYVTLARIHNGKGQYNLALEEIQRALNLEPRDPDALIAEAAIFSGMGQEEQAENLYKTAATLRPQNWNGFYEMGASYYRQGRDAEAADAFEKALRITPDNALIHAALGGVLQLLERYAEAEQHLKRSIEFQPSYAAYTNLGAFYLRRRRWAEAAAATRKALAINSTDWKAWANLGQALEWLNRKGEADQVYQNEQVRLEELLTVRSDDAEVQAELGLLHSKLRKPEKALPLIEAALVRAPEDPNILSTAAEAHENLGDRSAALELAKRALARGWTLEQLRNVASLRQLLLDPRFREITRESPNNSNPAQQ